MVSSKLEVRQLEPLCKEELVLKKKNPRGPGIYRAKIAEIKSRLLVLLKEDLANGEAITSPRIAGYLRVLMIEKKITHVPQKLVEEILIVVSRASETEQLTLF